MVNYDQGFLTYILPWMGLCPTLFYRVMLHRATVRHPSICDVEVCFSHRLEYFENNFTAE